MTNKSSITRLKDIPELKNAVDLLLGGDQLSLQQKEFLLSTAVLLIRDFEKTNLIVKVSSLHTGLSCRTRLVLKTLNHFMILLSLLVYIRFATQLHQ